MLAAKITAKASLVSLAVCGSLLIGANAASASAIAPQTVKQELSRSVPPSPKFLVSGICGTSGANDSATCTETVLKAIDAARKVEGINGMPATFSVKGFDSLSPAEQVFAIADIERTARGLAPIYGLTSQLDAIADKGAVAQDDPTTSLPLNLSGGGYSTDYGSNFAEGTANAIGADYFWMYDDGVDSPNADCQKASDSGCWGHRKNVIADYANTTYCPAGSKIYTLMGAAEVTQKVEFSPSITEIFVNDCGSLPNDVVYTWPQVQKTVFGH